MAKKSKAGSKAVKKQSSTKGSTAYLQGRKDGKRALAQVDARLMAMPAVTKGTLVADGDSWFDYFKRDILNQLEERGWSIESAANYGDKLEQMAYNGRQVQDLAKLFRKLQKQGTVPTAILLSGGGNDIVGTEFGMFLNHAASQLDPMNEDVVRGIVDVRLRRALEYLIGQVAVLSKECFKKSVPVVLHGYANALPDGRAVADGWPTGGLTPGPWMSPGFAEKGFIVGSADDVAVLSKTAPILWSVLARFNSMLKDVATGTPDVHYLDLRPYLNSEIPGRAYRKDWANEIHPKPNGFKRLTDQFEALLDGF